jgi:hypothetical protein
LATVDKVQAIVLNVETDQITGQHALQNFIRPREQTEDVPRWEWNVQEEGQLTLESLLLGHFAHIIGGQHEVVVVNPNDGRSLLRLVLVATLQRLDRFQGELFVHLDVGLPVVGAESRPSRHRMEQGPVGLITATVVVEVEQNGVNVNGNYLKEKVVGYKTVVMTVKVEYTHLAGFETCGWRVVGRIRFWDRLGLIVQMDARPTDPQAFAFDDHRSHCCDQTTGTEIWVKSVISRGQFS